MSDGSATPRARAWFRPVLAIARVTFWEVVRDKVLYNVFAVVVVLMGAGYLASRLSYGFPWRIVINLGFSVMGICSLLVGVLVGAGAIPREFERRTAWVTLSHPVSRYQFVWGKVLGIGWVLASNVALMAVVFALVLVASGGELSPVFAYGLWLVTLQSVLGAALALLISTFSTVSLSITITIGLALVGMNVGQLRFLAERAGSDLARLAFNGVARIIPNFEVFQAGEMMTYSLPVETALALAHTAYALALVALMALLSALLLKRRES